jgi:ribose transport system substrate-binding protein
MKRNSTLNSSTSRRRFLELSGGATLAGLSGCVTTGRSSQAEEFKTNPAKINVNEVEPDGLAGKGPNGHKPVSSKELTIPRSQKQKLKKGNYTVAIVFHYLKTAWVRLQRRGLTAQFKELNVNIEGIYGSDFNVQKQSNILTTLASKSNLDAIVSIPVDQVATAGAYREVAQSDIDIVFMDNIPKGFQYPNDYAGLVAADNRGNGLIAGRILAKLVGEGKVGMIMHDVPFYVTHEREQGALQALTRAEGIEIVKRGFTDENNVYTLAQNMLTANPKMKGMFVIWGAPPGVQAVAAAEDNIAITTIDLGSRTAQNMAQGGRIKGIGAQRPYDQGVAEATLAAQAMLGNKTPPYVAAPSLAVMRQNLLDAYRKVFHKKPPEEITEHLT